MKDRPKYEDYQILAHDGKKYRPVAGVRPNGSVIWATSKEDTLKWFRLDRQGLAARKNRLFKRFPSIKFSVRRV